MSAQPTSDKRAKLLALLKDLTDQGAAWSRLQWWVRKERQKWRAEQDAEVSAAHRVDTGNEPTQVQSDPAQVADFGDEWGRGAPSGPPHLVSIGIRDAEGAAGIRYSLRRGRIVTLEGEPDHDTDGETEKQSKHLPAGSWMSDVEAASEDYRVTRARDLLRTGQEGAWATLREAWTTLSPEEKTVFLQLEAPWDRTTETREAFEARISMMLEAARALAAVQGKPTFPVLEALNPAEIERLTLEKARRARSRLRWYRGRSRGQLKKFKNIEECGDHTVRITCELAGGCGVVREITHHCANGKLCLPCRQKLSRKRRKRFAIARARELQRARRKGLLHPRRRGGRWSEKFLTLTIPHVEADRWEEESLGPSAATFRRVQLIFRAWRPFSLRFQRWIRKNVPKGQKVVWYRAFEWTFSELTYHGKPDGNGHPHFHLWILSPLLDHALIREWWAQSLRDVGEDVTDVVTHLREIRTRREDFRRELIKPGALKLQAGGLEVQKYIEGWSIVDQDTSGKASPEVIARLLAALEGRRLTQTSKGLLEPPIAICPFCHELNTCTIRFIRAEEEWGDQLAALEPHAARGPP
jgi:hypothetical protein